MAALYIKITEHIYFSGVRAMFTSINHILGHKTNLKNFVVQLLNPVQLFGTPWTATCQASLSITIYLRLLKHMSIDLVMPSNHLILCWSLLLLPTIFPSIRFFSNELACLIMCPKYWGFSFSISPSNEYSGLISFRIDWFGLLSVQGTIKSLLQHHSLKASVLQHSAFFMFSLFPLLFAIKWWDQMPWSLFFDCWVLSQLFHSPLSPSSRSSRSSSSLAAIRVVSSAFLRLLIFLPAILIPACDPSSPAFHMMCSA